MSSVILNSVKLHRWVRYLSFVGLILFVISAMTHPVMIWIGPQPVKMHPPKLQVNEFAVDNLSSILNDAKIQSPLLVKVVATADGPVLQITEREKEPRRYFDLTSGKEIKDYDQNQAVWLARYYTGSDQRVVSIEFISEFSAHYPSVNRLLPVYKIAFDSTDQTTVYIYTETNSLAAISNNWKNVLQSLFGNLHTWSWLDSYPLARIVLMTVMLLILFLTLITGLVQLFFRRRSKISTKNQNNHRRIAWVVVIPLAALLLSGLYHLQFYQFGENNFGLRLSAPLLIEKELVEPFSQQWKDSLTEINSFSMIEHQGELYYRIGLSRKIASHVQDDSAHVDEAGGGHHRQHRFDGRPSEDAAVYVAVKSGEIVQLSDQVVAASLAKDYLQMDAVQIKDVSLVTRFSPEYDFRNKRLPVWRVDTQIPKDHMVFVDPVTSVLAEHITPMMRTERWSFSWLHKWDFIVPLVGRQVRDVLVIGLLASMALLAWLGIVIAGKKARV